MVWVHSNRVSVLRFSTDHSLRIYIWNEAQYICHWIFLVCFLIFTLFYPLFSLFPCTFYFYFKTFLWHDGNLHSHRPSYPSSAAHTSHAHVSTVKPIP
ncbi:unnamed protein product, partial [Vitis vinifera]|uniref:Uncharacterized protein n=1 Tax=Vitis vinifera TaxID=29760 RepID=D7SIC3_VITVI